MNMIDVVIDSNIYRSEGFKSPKLATLKDMGTKNFVKIHIPWFVYKECVTQNIEKGSEPFNKAIEAMKKASVHYGINEINEIQNKLTCLKNNVIDIEQKKWKDFIEISKAKLYDYDKEGSQQVFEDYFEGNPPFSALKARKDIPDAFIFQDIKKISQSVDVDNVYVITNDQKFNKELEEKIPKTTTYSSIDEFFKDPNFKSVKEKYDNFLLEEEEAMKQKSLKLQFVKEYIKDCDVDIKKDVSKYLSKINYLEFDDDNLLSDSRNAIITHIELEDFSISYESIKLIGNEIFVPIIAICDANIDFPLSICDYWEYKHYDITIEDELSDSEYLVTQKVRLELSQNIIIDIDDVIMDKDEEFVPIPIDEFEKIKDNFRIKNKNLEQNLTSLRSEIKALKTELEKKQSEFDKSSAKTQNESQNALKRLETQNDELKSEALSSKAKFESEKTFEVPSLNCVIPIV